MQRLLLLASLMLMYILYTVYSYTGLRVNGKVVWSNQKVGILYTPNKKWCIWN